MHEEITLTFTVTYCETFVYAMLSYLIPTTTQEEKYSSRGGSGDTEVQSLA